MRDSAGRAKAAVLPVPVCAWPSMSAPGQQHRYGRRLDGRRSLVADVAERFEHGLGQRQAAKARGVRGFCLRDCTHGLRLEY